MTRHAPTTAVLALLLAGAVTNARAAQADEGAPTGSPDRTIQHAVYAEGGGAAFYYSGNYELRIGMASLRAGLSVNPSDEAYSHDPCGSDTTYECGEAQKIFIPIGGSLILGGDHAAELGGAVIPGEFGILSAMAGYRYQPASGGLFFRAAVLVVRMPHVGGTWDVPGHEMWPWLGISLGYSTGI